MSEIVAGARQDRPLAGILLMLGAFLCFSFIDAGAKWLAVLSMPPLQLAFMRYFPHFLIDIGVAAASISAPRPISGDVAAASSR